MPEAQWQKWLEALNPSQRHTPDFFLSDDSILEAPHAGALRVAFAEGLKAVFNANGSPSVGFIVMDPFDPVKLQRLHKVLWNQGLLSVLVVLTDNDLRLFSLTQRKLPRFDRAGTPLDPRLISTLNLLTNALEVRSLLSSIESGNFFIKHNKKFNTGQRIDRVLLRNLNTSLIKLHNLGLPLENAQALLMQSMLISYLEDREILTQKYFEDATEGLASSWKQVLEIADINKGILPLFSQLDLHFNGSVFYLPGNFSESKGVVKIERRHLSVLFEFRRGDIEMHSGQYKLISYDFRYIPVALISAIYNSFLDAKPGERRLSGAYYTPLHLVDLTVEQAWLALSDQQRLEGKVLDPACGSGVFLVRMFELIIEFRRLKKLPLEWEDLIEIVQRLHGIEINETALRLTAISLYIALLEQKMPRDIQLLMEQKRLLPPLIGEEPLILNSFFVEDRDSECKYDLIVGNPPWKSRGREHGDRGWTQGKKLPMPEKELAWAFIWKSGQHLKDDGIAAILLPAMGFLHNANSSTARKVFFKKFNALKVINLSDMRFILFDGATRPTALAIFKKCLIQKNYSFKYISPKSDLFSQRKMSFGLSSADHTNIKSIDVQKNSNIFIQNFWLRNRGHKLLQYILSFPLLSAHIYEFKKLRNKSIKGKWVIGQGCKPALEKRLDDPEYSYEILEEVTKYPFLDVSEDFTILGLKKIKSSPLSSALVHRRGFTEGFYGSHILIPHGLSTDGRVRAAFDEQNLIFRHTIQAIKFPPNESQNAKALTAVLNSKLAAWFYFISSANVAFERDKVHEKELLSLPCPLFSKEFSHSKNSNAAVDCLSSIIDKFSSSFNDNGILKVDQSIDTILHELDEATYSLYDLSSEEKFIINDFYDFIFPSSQPHTRTCPVLWGPCEYHHRKEYANTIQRALKLWFPDNNVQISCPALSKDLAIIRLRLNSAPISENNYKEFDNDIHFLLDNIWQKISSNPAYSFNNILNLRIIIDDELYIIKPTKLRYWLKSSALEEVDGIVADLHSFSISGLGGNVQ
jgi:type I restriction-modification system DNA methylase subunit